MVTKVPRSQEALILSPGLLVAGGPGRADSFLWGSVYSSVKWQGQARRCLYVCCSDGLCFPDVGPLAGRGWEAPFGSGGRRDLVWFTVLAVTHPRNQGGTHGRATCLLYLYR